MASTPHVSAVINFRKTNQSVVIPQKDTQIVNDYIVGILIELINGYYRGLPKSLPLSLEMKNEKLINNTNTIF